MRNPTRCIIITLFCVGLCINPIFNMWLRFIYQNSIHCRIESIKAKNDPQKIKSSLILNENSFSSAGITQNVELSHYRNELFINYSLSNEGVTIQNPKSGWNLTSFDLEFNDLYTTETLVQFETTNDGVEKYKGVDKFYGLSFCVPNTCYLKNLFVYLQYWGSSSGTDESEFTIKVYNATSFFNETIPDEPINTPLEETLFILTNKAVNQPAQWYQSNFTNLILNISKTFSNTFFAVFQSLKYPNLAGYNDEAFISYGIEQSYDEFNSLFYKKSGLLGSWELLPEKNGLLKANFAPVAINPTPEQVNLSVFNTPIDSTGKYSNQSFFPHDRNEFFIPISSPWFGDIQFNATFRGNFIYKTKSSSNFKAEAEEDVLWNLTLNVNDFSSNSFNNSAIFYKPNYWELSSIYNESILYSNFEIHQNYVKIINISNNMWIINFNQINDVISKTYKSSSDKKNWREIVDIINSTHLINVSAHFRNSNGQASLLVTTTLLDISISVNLQRNNYNFPLWSAIQNTSILENNLNINIKLITFNGTIAGILSNNYQVQLIKNETVITLETQIKENYIQGAELKFSAKLCCGEEPIIGKTLFFTISEIHSNGRVEYSNLNHTTDHEGMAEVIYHIPKIDAFNLEIFYEGDLLLYSSTFKEENINVRTPTHQFFIDNSIIFVLLVGIIIAFFSYLIVRKINLKKNKAVWEQKSKLCNDFLNLEYIVIIEKNSGIALVQENIGQANFEGALISGFLQAITIFKYELRKERVSFDSRESILLDYQDYKILLNDGVYIRVGLILKANPSELFKYTLNEFIKQFEIKYLKHIKHFNGELSPFEDFSLLTNKFFKTNFRGSLIVNKNLLNTKMSSFQENILNVAMIIEDDYQSFNFAKLFNYLIKILPKVPREKIESEIYNLLELLYIIPKLNIKEENSQ